MQGKKLQVYKSDVVIEDFYKHYLKCTYNTTQKKGINTDDTTFVIQKTYSRILQKFNQEIYKLLFTGFIFRIPQVGEISLRLKKVEPYINSKGDFVNPLPVDRRATKLLWESDPEAKKEKRQVYHENDHSSGYILKLYYDKYSGLNHTLLKDYRIKTTRTMALDMVKLMKKGDYLNKFHEINKNLL